MSATYLYPLAHVSRIILNKHSEFMLMILPNKEGFGKSRYIFLNRFNQSMKYLWSQLVSYDELMDCNVMILPLVQEPRFSYTYVLAEISVFSYLSIFYLIIFNMSRFCTCQKLG